MRFVPSPRTVSAAAANVTHKLVHGRLADLRPMPHALIDRGPSRSIYHYGPLDGEQHGGAPVLLVPPLAAPTRCFDLRRGCSMVEHLVDGGRPTYVVDYGEISFADRHLGLEHWVDDVIPHAVEAVSAHSNGHEVHVVGWCLGGIMTLLAVAADHELPIRSVTAVASPFDVDAVPFIVAFRPLLNAAGGSMITPLYRAFGGAPATLVRWAYQLASVDRYLTKPLVIATNLADRDFLAQIEAVDHFTSKMLAYPGRTFGQLYHRFLRANDLASGYLDLSGRRIEIATVEPPVLVVAGADDAIAPVNAVAHLVDLLTGAASVRFEIAPGGHLGVLTGRRARRTTWRLVDQHLAENDA
ncbi:MAG TPA: alpha/beta fold hydrolase [Mycobacteriales bacterium]|nr:alpha/beta fold hydrolase [Mycobacteriales bacterium]